MQQPKENSESTHKPRSMTDLLQSGKKKITVHTKTKN